MPLKYKDKGVLSHSEASNKFLLPTQKQELKNQRSNSSSSESETSEFTSQQLVTAAIGLQSSQKGKINDKDADMVKENLAKLFARS